jgi:hypothetical protein
MYITQRNFDKMSQSETTYYAHAFKTWTVQKSLVICCENWAQQDDYIPILHQTILF